MSTLTGSMVHTLGKDHCGLYSNCNVLAKGIVSASQLVGEKVVQQEIYEENINNIK
jgi:leucyl aminopeptidase